MDNQPPRDTLQKRKRRANENSDQLEVRRAHDRESKRA